MKAVLIHPLNLRVATPPKPGVLQDRPPPLLIGLSTGKEFDELSLFSMRNQPNIIGTIFDGFPEWSPFSIGVYIYS